MSKKQIEVVDVEPVPEWFENYSPPVHLSHQLTDRQKLLLKADEFPGMREAEAVLVCQSAGINHRISRRGLGFMINTRDVRRFRLNLHISIEGRVVEARWG